VAHQALPLILDELATSAPHSDVVAHQAWSRRAFEAVLLGEAEAAPVREFAGTAGLCAEVVEDHLFIGPVSVAKLTWDGFVDVPVVDEDARMGLSIVWPAGETPPRVERVLKAVRDVSGREGRG